MHKHVRLIAATGVAVITMPTALAFAHAQIKSLTPGKNTTVHHNVTDVHVTFSESVITGLLTIKKGNETIPLKANGLKTNHHAILRAIPKQALTKGSYTVDWRAVADDGHHQKGSWSFKVG